MACSRLVLALFEDVGWRPAVRIVEQYSHLNGYEFLKVHKPALWDEITDVIGCLDAEACRTKVSKEVRTLDRMLYSPVAMTAAMKATFAGHGWSKQRTSEWVTSDAKLMRKTMHMPARQQKAEIEGAGLQAIASYNRADIVKDRVAAEVQFGKHASVTFDLFAKHMALYVCDVIDVGVQILPMKALQERLSSGLAYYEGELYNLIRGMPAAPLILLGVAP